MKPRAYRSEILIFLLFILLSLIAAYPLIFKMGNSIYGYPGDSFTTIWKFWWLKYSIWEKHISPFFCPYQAAPLGVDLKSLPQVGFYFYFVPLMLFFFDEIATYNIILLSGFFLSAVTMYFLVYHFTRNKGASMVSGIIYAFCPFHLIHAMHHLSLASIQWMPLYLGWVGIVLSLIAVREWRRRGRKQVRLRPRRGSAPEGKWESGQASKKPRAESREQRAESGEKNSMLRAPSSKLQDPGSRIKEAVSFFLLLGLVALLFSHAPYAEIGNYRILFPSYFMYKIIPMFRIYARFGILVLLSVSILAGIGLTLVLGRMKGEKKKGILVSSIILLILIEFIHVPPFHTTDLSAIPEVYQWLSKQEGDFIVAEYPLESYQGSGYYLFYQRVHKKRLINGALPGSEAYQITKELINLSRPETVGILKSLGIKYLVLHPERYLRSDEVEVIGRLPALEKSEGLKLAKVFKESKVYKIE